MIYRMKLSILLIMFCIVMNLKLKSKQTQQQALINSQIETMIIGTNLTQVKDQLNGDGYKVLNVFPRTHQNGHQYFVQGFKFDKDSDQIIESAGLYGESEIHKLDIKKMEITDQQKLDSQYFGEGNDWIIVNDQKEYHQLTYKERTVFVYDQDLKYKKSYQIPYEIREGWGLKHIVLNDKYYLLVTDGTERVFVVDPDGWTIRLIYQVIENGRYQPMLNDLEIIDNYLYANVFLTNDIVKIDIQSLLQNGVNDRQNSFKIVRRYDLTRIVDSIKQTNYYKENHLDYGHCLNGIAYNSKDGSQLFGVLLQSVFDRQEVAGHIPSTVYTMIVQINLADSIKRVEIQ